MLAEFEFFNKKYRVNLAEPIDISMPLRNGEQNANCFWAPPVQIEPVRMGDFVGSVELGGPVNFVNIKLNPHGNGTHTECVGHISRENSRSTNRYAAFIFWQNSSQFFPKKRQTATMLFSKNNSKNSSRPGECEAIIIRSLPNGPEKLTAKYSGANPPYFHHEAIEYLVECSCQHLLTDLPSVDREEDGGRLAAHKAWWKYPGPAVRETATITELVFVENEIRDGLFLLNLQIAPLETDASPSKPVIYRCF